MAVDISLRGLDLFYSRGLPTTTFARTGSALIFLSCTSLLALSTHTVAGRIKHLVRRLTMSTRTQVLQDYNIRLTSASDIPSQSSIRDASPAEDVQNPPGWYDEHRQVPPYRPVNRELDRSLRPFGSNGPEMAFVMNMFAGVWVIATTSWAWRNTAGKINPKWFRYQVGGEF